MTITISYNDEKSYRMKRERDSNLPFKYLSSTSVFPCSVALPGPQSRARPFSYYRFAGQATARSPHQISCALIVSNDGGGLEKRSLVCVCVSNRDPHVHFAPPLLDYYLYIRSALVPNRRSWQCGLTTSKDGVNLTFIRNDTLSANCNAKNEC